jgi:hypothetical protein
MNQKKDCEKLINELLPVSERLLIEYGEFYPFAGYLTSTDKIVQVGALDPQTNHPQPQALFAILRSSLKHQDRQCKAIAIVLHVSITLPGSPIKSDAIKVLVEHVDGYSADVFFPYSIRTGEIVYGTTFAQASEGRILK